MAAYSVVMFICSAVISVMAYMLCKGNKSLMPEHEQRNVRDKLAYGKMLGKGYFIMSIFFALSGIVGLLGDAGIVVVAAVLHF